MGLFDFRKKEVSVPKDSDTKLSLEKHKLTLDKVVVALSKSGVDLSKHTARVALAMDYSGSMRHLFRNGNVQDTITRLLPLALRFDDNGKLESWLFSNDIEKIEPITKNNYKSYVTEEMLNANMSMSGTYYAPVLKDILHYYKVEKPSRDPAFIIFITDGANSDKKDTDEVIRELSKENVFVQFIGIGNESFSYLKKLDDLNGREKDNTGFISIRDISKMDDQELYKELLRQYKDWLNSEAGF